MKSPTPAQIKQVRTLAGLTQKQAAEMCHVTLGGYQHWEYGVRKMHPGLFELLVIKIDRDKLPWSYEEEE